MNLLLLIILSLILLVLLYSAQSFIPITNIKLPHAFAFSVKQRRIVKWNSRKYPSLLSTQELGDNIITDEDNKNNNNGLLLNGRRKWLGGIVNKNDGSIYGIPSHAKSLLKISFITETAQHNNTTTIPKIESIPLALSSKSSIATVSLRTKRRFKWLRGIIYNNNLYCIPSWSQDGILQINLNDEHNDDSSMNMNVIPFPLSGSNDNENDRWLYHGGVLIENNNNTGMIYCIPSNANRILKITCNHHDNLTTASEHIGPTFLNDDDTIMKNKWYGGIKGFDNATYGIPYSSQYVLRIDNNNNDKITLLGTNLTTDKYKWHGGILSPINGCIYGIPSHATTILKINTTDCNNTIITQLPIPFLDKNHVTDIEQKYKWGGTAIGKDGCIYALPSNSNTILKINPAANDEIITLFGNDALLSTKYYNNDNDHDRNDKKLMINKWQGAVLANDGHVYAIPCNANAILRINTISNSIDYNTIQLIDISFLFVQSSNNRQMKDKYQGGFLSIIDGNVYCIPENANGVLRIQPPIGDGDVKVDLLV